MKKFAVIRKGKFAPSGTDEILSRHRTIEDATRNAQLYVEHSEDLFFFDVEVVRIKE
jgi:hypothetical protein